jgi:hypothetical protein
MSDFACEWNVTGFSATAVYTGENKLVRVQGSGTCPQSGFRVVLEEVNPGIVPEPNRLHLGLREEAPAAGAEVVTDVSIDESFDVSQEVTEVVIRGLGVLEVDEPA